MFGSVNPWCGEPPTGEPDAGEPHVRFGGGRDRATGLSYPYHKHVVARRREHQLPIYFAYTLRAWPGSLSPLMIALPSGNSAIS